MDVLQCNIVQQMVFILEGLVPKPKTEEQEVAASVHESVEGKKRLIFKHYSPYMDWILGKHFSGY